MTINHFHWYELKISKANVTQLLSLMILTTIHFHDRYLQDVLLEVEWMACELVCEAATVAKLPALVVAM